MSRWLSIFVLGVIICLLACEKPDNEAPVAEFEIQPRFGDSQTVFHFNAGPSTDNFTDKFRLKVRWDFYDDGNWESDFSIIKSYAFKFPENGLYDIRCEVMDDSGNSSSIFHQVQVAPVPRDSVFIDSRDGQKYKAVFLFDRWWMSQNLNYGNVLINEFATDNSIVEKYLYPDSVYDSHYGGYYTWNEAMDYGRNKKKGICPEGWRMPVEDDINRITEILWFTEDYSSYLLNAGIFGLDITLCGKYIHTNDSWDSQNYCGNFWINYEQAFEKFVTWARIGPRDYYSGYNYKPYLLTDYNPLASRRVSWQDEWGPFTYHKVALPIRCIKNHEID